MIDATIAGSLSSLLCSKFDVLTLELFRTGCKGCVLGALIELLTLVFSIQCGPLNVLVASSCSQAFRMALTEVRAPAGRSLQEVHRS